MYNLIKLQKHACVFILQNRNLMVHRANQRLYWMIHLTFGHYYWMILQKNLGMTPPYYSGRGRYTKGFNDFRIGTLNQYSFLLYVYHVSTIIIVIIILIIIIMIRKKLDSCEWHLPAYMRHPLYAPPPYAPRPICAKPYMRHAYATPISLNLGLSSQSVGRKYPAPKPSMDTPVHF